MNNINLRLEIADFIGFCDLNGEDALDSSQVEKLEDYIYKCYRRRPYCCRRYL